jgi:hypothetical protein
MSGHSHAQARESFEGTMKQTLINSTVVCERKCVKPSNDDHLSVYEKACLGKCFDKYYLVYDHNLNSIVSSMKKKQVQSEYTDKF